VASISKKGKGRKSLLVKTAPSENNLKFSVEKEYVFQILKYFKKNFLFLCIFKRKLFSSKHILDAKLKIAKNS